MKTMFFVYSRRTPGAVLRREGEKGDWTTRRFHPDEDYRMHGLLVVCSCYGW